jgi:hypothetical protein
LPALDIPGAWKTTAESRTCSRFTGRLRLHGQDIDVGVRVERCVAGRLREAYPAGAGDLEVRIDRIDGIDGGCPHDTLAELLRTLVDAVRAADPRCRRIVYAAAEDDQDAIAAATAAGFRPVVAVDLGEQQLGLLVVEPDRGSAIDTDLDHVPGT